tara:strand:+ start:813 stop:2435 length:1623 start_codon:yes stop_codon:yes gene_type:complete
MEKTKELRAEYEVNADQAPWMLLMSATGADGVVVQGWGLKEQLLLRRVCKTLAGAASVPALVVGAYEGASLPPVKLGAEERAALVNYPMADTMRDPDLLRARVGQMRRVAEMLETMPWAVAAGGYAVELATRHRQEDRPYQYNDLDVFIPDGQSVDVAGWRKRHDEREEGFQRFLQTVVGVVRTYAMRRLETNRSGPPPSWDNWHKETKFDVEVQIAHGAAYNQWHADNSSIVKFQWNVRQERDHPFDPAPVGGAGFIDVLRLQYRKAQRKQHLLHQSAYETGGCSKTEALAMLKRMARAEGLVAREDDDSVSPEDEVNAAEAYRMLELDPREKYGEELRHELAIVAYVKVRPTEESGSSEFRWVELSAEPTFLYYGVLMSNEDGQSFEVPEHGPFTPHREGCVNIVQYVGPQKKPLEVMQTFDLRMCQVALTGEGGRLRIHMSDETRDDLAHRRLRLGPHALPSVWTQVDLEGGDGPEEQGLREVARGAQMCNLLHRVRKYLERGFSTAGGWRSVYGGLDDRLDDPPGPEPVEETEDDA